MSGAFPDSLNLSTKPQAVPARSYRHNLTPVNGSIFQPSSSIKWDIPTGGNTFLNQSQSYLKFKVRNKDATNATALSSSGYGVFQRLEIYHGSQLLESINEYGNLCNSFMEAQASTNACDNGLTLLGGKAGATTGAAIAADATVTVCLPIVSGIIGNHCSKYLPLAYLSAAPLRLELTLETVAQGVRQAAGAGDWEIFDAEYVMQVTELDSSAMRMIDQATRGSVEISCESFRNYNSVLANGSSSTSQLVPAKFSSLKSMYVTARDTAVINSITAYGHRRVYPTTGVLTSQWRVGSLNVPQKPISNVHEHFSELAKSLHALSDFEAGGTLSALTYGSGGNKFLIGQELESFSHRTDVLESGINTLSQNVYFDQTMTVATATELRYDFYALFDMFLVISNGLASVRF